MRPPRSSTARGPLALTAVLLVVAGLLAGCAGPTSVADRAYQGMPDSLSEAEQAQLISGVPNDEYVNLVWLDVGSRFALITFGSSSCPWVVTRLEATGTASVHVRLELAGGDACTDDLAPITHELTLPSSVTERPVEVQLTYSNWDSVTHLRLE